MSRTPQSEDENNSDGSQTTHKRRMYGASRYQRPFYMDEHPEVPQIRRASRYDTQHPQSRPQSTSSRTSRRVPGPEEFDQTVREIEPFVTTETAYEEDELPNTTGRMPATRRRRPVVEEEPEAETYTRSRRRPIVEEEAEAETITTSRRHAMPIPEELFRDTQAARRIRTPIRTRPFRKQRKAQQRTYGRWQQLSHNRVLVILCITAAVLLIAIPVLHSVTQNNATIMPNMTTSTTDNQANSGNSLSNANEIVITPPQTAHPAPPVNATAAYLINANTGATLYAHNPFMHLPIMSTTKLMTATIAVEHGNMNQEITINSKIEHDLQTQLSPDSSLMGIKAGETYTLHDLMEGLLLVSGNDAAIVIADAISGSVPQFVTLMNQKAQQLHMDNTHFENPDGLLAAGHYSCAHDLAIIAQYSFNITQIHQIVNTRTYTIPATKQHTLHTMYNSDQFLWWYPGADAGKTGWDAASNFVQISEVTRGNQKLIGVLIHTNDWWTDMRDLMDYGFNDYTWITPRTLYLKELIPYAADWSYFISDKQTNTIPIGNQGRYYIFTGYSISGAIMTFYDKNGGLNKIGYPRSQPQSEANNSESQRFDHGTIQCNLNTNQCHLA
ncbi:MAG TPA: D-alanyl-D-alanine carboxypeptidase family protein [Dictyobacter sp.]|jgi:D-alanyl-D-alanine carboxypeptidase|nr:D-alanyl-D-alanine carboxypeptidase family protein [Dictyobacter sp.]